MAMNESETPNTLGDPNDIVIIDTGNNVQVDWNESASLQEFMNGLPDTAKSNIEFRHVQRLVRQLRHMHVANTVTLHNEIIKQLTALVGNTQKEDA